MAEGDQAMLLQVSEKSELWPSSELRQCCEVFGEGRGAHSDVAKENNLLILPAEND